MSWSTTGNTGTNPPTNFIGTTNNKPLVIVTNNNTAAGTYFTVKGQIQPLGLNGSLFFGQYAGDATNTASASNDVFLGFKSGILNTTGSDNIAIGTNALSTNLTSNQRMHLPSSMVTLVLNNRCRFEQI